MKYKPLHSVAIFFITTFYRPGGSWPLGPPWIPYWSPFLHQFLFFTAVGYHLIIVKGQNFNLTTTTDIIQGHESGSRMLTDAGAEVTFTLRKDQTACFEQLLLELENRKGELGIMTFGLSVTTLEEVFLK